MSFRFYGLYLFKTNLFPFIIDRDASKSSDIFKRCFSDKAPETVKNCSSAALDEGVPKKIKKASNKYLKRSLYSSQKPVVEGKGISRVNLIKSFLSLVILSLLNSKM